MNRILAVAIAAVASVGSTTIFEDVKIVPSDGDTSDKFGFSAGHSGDTMVVSTLQDDDVAPEAGSAYVYVRNGSAWSLQQKLLAADGDIGDWFGYSADIDGDTVVIGSRMDDDNGGNSGSVYVYVRSGQTWTEQQKLIASDGEATDLFGHSIDLDGDTLIIGAIGDDDQALSAGAAYVFVRNGQTWTEQQKLTASDGGLLDEFGTSVVVEGDQAIVGSIGDDDNGDNAGAVYVFTRNASIWSEVAKVKAFDGATSDNFGLSVDLEGDTFVTTAPADDDNGSTSGSAYVFVGAGPTWTLEQKVLPNDGSPQAQFGESSALENDRLVVGAWNEANVQSGAGSAYEFVRSGTTWQQRHKLVASDAAQSDNFGGTLGLSDGGVVVGAQNDDDNGNNSGSAYFYQLALGRGILLRRRGERCLPRAATTARPARAEAAGARSARARAPRRSVG